MAWFEDLAKGAGYSTLGKLARAAVVRGDWPAEETRNDRSVENMLRLLDQGQRKGQVWLDKREELKNVLADLLNVSSEALDPGLQDVEAPADPRVELKELREAKPIDLRKESLYPGIPEEVFDPTKWRRSWWLAQSGAGKTLVGKWLQANRRATFLRCETLGDVLPQMPETGAVYIELSLPDATDVTRWAEQLDGRQVCVAAPFLPAPVPEVVETESAHQDWQAVEWGEVKPDEPQFAAGWDGIQTPPKEAWVENLIRWVGARMKEGGGFDVGGALAIVHTNGFDDVLATPGDYIGLCGVIEKLGIKRVLESVETEQLAFAFLESRLERTDLPGRSARTPKDLWRLICGCVEGAIVNSGTVDRFPSEQVLRQWLPVDALPAAYDREELQIVDSLPLKMQDVLLRETRSVDGAILELRRLHLLEPIGGGVVVLRPNWITGIAAQRALRELLSTPERGLGKVLLFPRAVERALCTLRDLFIPGEDDRGELVELGWKLVDNVVSAVRRDDAESVAVLEAVFQGLGVALLDAKIPARLSDLQRLWDKQMSLTVNRFKSAPPQPRIFEVERDSMGWECGWYVAALSISERLAYGGSAPPAGPLAPWSAVVMPEFADQVVSALERVCIFPTRSARDGHEIANPPDFVLDAWRLAGRLYRRFGSATSAPSARMVNAPFALFEAIKRNEVATWEGRLDHVYFWDVLSELATDEGLGMDDVIAALWQARDSQNQMVLHNYAPLPDVWRKKVWKLLPPEVLKSALKDKIFQHDGIAWQELQAGHWDVIIEQWRAIPLGQPRTLCGIEHIPEARARIVIRERLGGAFNDRGYQLLWDRFPSLCTEEAVLDLADPNTSHATLGVLWCTPNARLKGVIEATSLRLPEILANPDTRLHLVRWSRYQCSKRGEHWRMAWQLLNEALCDDESR